MRFVEWNCCEGFASDLPALLELGCDLAVLCEVPEMPPPVNLIDPEIDWHWAGRYPRKGLAIASFGGPLTRGAERIGAGSFTVSAETKAGIGILGIWTCPPRGSSYGAQARATIDTYADWLRDTPSIVAGDVNVAPRGIEDTRTGVLRALFADLDALGYRSVYHHYFGEEYGAETRATYFHRRRPAEPFHIDFVFLHQDLLPQVRAVEVGTYERWGRSPQRVRRRPQRSRPDRRRSRSLFGSAACTRTVPRGSARRHRVRRRHRRACAVGLLAPGQVGRVGQVISTTRPRWSLAIVPVRGSWKASSARLTRPAWPARRKVSPTKQ